MNTRVEQAIFTSLRGERMGGYQLAVTSPGIDAELARRLTGWGPAHDSLLNPAPGATSVNFHPLSDDLFALSKTTRQGGEYSGRGGGRIFTHFFVLSRETLARFSNHPLAVLQAIVAAGRTRIPESLPDKLSAFSLAGRAASWDSATDCGEFDSRALDMLADLIRNQSPAAVVCSEPAESWLKAAYARLTTEERLQVSFTTGLRPTPCRPFLLSVLPDEPALVRQSQRTGGTVVYLSPLATAQ